MQDQGIFERPWPSRVGHLRKSLAAAVAGRGLGWSMPETLTIRASILLGFAVICLFTAALGFSGARVIGRLTALETEAFDQLLLSTNYARAAAADFASMQAALLELTLTTDPAHRREYEADLGVLADSFRHDLALSAERSHSARVREAAEAINAAVDRWQESAAGIGPQVPFRELTATGDSSAETVSHQIDRLIELIARDGLSTHQQAVRSIDSGRRLDIGLTLAALMTCGLVTSMLTRRITKPMAAASGIAAKIAGGDLEVVVPTGCGDEIGALLTSMATMRDSIRNMTDAEMPQHRSAQARLLDAVENAQEGVVLVDRDGRIVISNAPMAAFFSGMEGHLGAGAPFSDLLAGLRRTRLLAESRSAIERLDWPLVSEEPGIIEVGLDHDRWLRISWCMTRERGLIAFFSDVTLRRGRENQLQQTNLWFDAALSNMSQGLCVFDSEARLKVVNSRFCEIFSLSRDALRIGMPFEDVLAQTETDQIRCGTGVVDRKSIRDLIATRTEFTRNQFFGDGRVVSCSHRAISDGGWVLTYEDVTERQRSEARIEFLARHDPLTNLPNRVLFSERLNQALAAPADGPTFSLLLIDLDRFKEVNDSHGHPVGDRLLHLVADRLVSCCRQEDTVARLGGDEFAVIQMALNDEQEAVRLANRVIDTLSDPFSIDGKMIEIGASVGIAVAAPGGTDADTLLREADTALYRVKGVGRGNYSVFTPSMDAALQDRRALEHDLHRSLAEQQMEMLYQPIIRIADGSIAGFEALVRWHHPSRGTLSPGDFIALAEGSGYIEKLGAWVLCNACRDATEWPAGLRVAINLSPLQFRSGQLVPLLRQALEEAGVAPSSVELEITETTVLHESEATLDSLRAMHALGVTIALDDFGTGFSSLRYLRGFPFDRIKIDRCFVADYGLCDNASAIVRAVVGLGRSLGIPVTAEGVETQAQFQMLGIEGCDEAQGYLVSKPIRRAMIPPLIRSLSQGLGLSLNA